MSRKTTTGAALMALLALSAFAVGPRISAQTSSSSQISGPAAPAVLQIEAPSNEDLTTISLSRSGLPLPSTGGVLLSKVELPDCTRELLRLQWRPGDPIDLYLIRPRNAVKPAVVLYLFDYTKDSDIFRRDEWCRQVRETGMAAAGFASALAGQRFHAPRPMKEWFVSELQEALASSTHDVQMIVTYLGSRGDLDTQRLGIFGQGSGGSIAILAAAADPRITALDVVDPWGDWPDWLEDSTCIPEKERPAYLTPEFLQKVSTLDPAKYLPGMKGRAVRIEQVMDYSVNPPVVRDTIAAAAPDPGDVKRYDNIMALNKAWQSTGLTGWLGEQLRPTTSSK